MNYTKYCNANVILGFINTFSQNSARKMYENATKLGRFVKINCRKGMKSAVFSIILKKFARNSQKILQNR